MSVRTRIALGTLCSFNAFTTAVLGVLALLYVDGVAGKAVAAGLWIGSIGLVRLARRLRREMEWG